MNGNFIVWRDSILENFGYPSVDNALSIFRLSKSQFIWNCGQVLENIPVTLPDTEEIINGKTVSSLTIEQTLKLMSFSKAFDFVADTIENGTFESSKRMLNTIHSFASKYEVPDSQRGSFRTRNVQLKNMTYTPPDMTKLNEIWRTEIEPIMNNDRLTKLEQSIVLFAAMSRIQFFYDTNKRTNFLFMNANLVANGFMPFFTPISESKNFTDKLCSFYETGHADEFVEFLADTASITENLKCVAFFNIRELVRSDPAEILNLAEKQCPLIAHEALTGLINGAELLSDVDEFEECIKKFIPKELEEMNKKFTWELNGKPGGQFSYILK